MPNILILPIIDVFYTISGYRRYKIIFFRCSPARGGYRGAFCSACPACPSTSVTTLEDSTLPVTSFGLPCWAQWHWEHCFTHFKLFYFPNVIGLDFPTNWIVRFECVPNWKPRTERFNKNMKVKKVKWKWHTAKYSDPYSEFVLYIYPSKCTHTAVSEHTHLHLCISQMLLSKATYSAFRLYILSVCLFPGNWAHNLLRY